VETLRQALTRARSARATFEDLQVALDLAWRLRRALRAESQRLSALTPEQGVVLCRIELNGGRATISQISAEVSRTAHSVTGMVDRLEEKGLVARRRAENADRRQVFVELTGKGRRQIVAYRKAAESLLDTLNRMPPDQTHHHLSQVIEGLQALLGDE
jgi:DNA-binding MarR family transcriptional regulator